MWHFNQLVGAMWIWSNDHHIGLDTINNRFYNIAKDEQIYMHIYIIVLILWILIQTILLSSKLLLIMNITFLYPCM